MDVLCYENNILRETIGNSDKKTEKEKIFVCMKAHCDRISYKWAAAAAVAFYNRIK